MIDAVVFAGPSLSAADTDALLAERRVELRPPARRGDVAAAARELVPRVIVLIDGFFHQALSVGHVELRQALHEGISVYGLSSLGAIRAAEMASLGMRPYGTVAALFCHVGFDDDEVALLHGEDPPYHAASEPLVHLRALLGDAVDRGIVDDGQRAVLVNDLKTMWYGDRTLQVVRQRLRDAVDIGRARDVDALIDEAGRFRGKSADAAEFVALGVQAWIDGDVPRPDGPPPWWRPEWSAEIRPERSPVSGHE